jgi:FtsP/CotA-like multicopper oxidase with cupredoxin domain
VTQTGCGVRNVNDGLGIANGIFTYKGSCGTPTVDTAWTSTLNTQTDCKDEPLASLIPVQGKSGGTLEKFNSIAQLLPGGNGGSQTFANYGPIIRWLLGPPTPLATTPNTPQTLGANTINVDFDQPTLKSMATLPSVGFNNSIYSNAVVLDGPANDWVYFVIQNNFQTSHPMHLHGHDFSVLGQGKGVFSASQVSTLNFQNPIRRDTALLFGIVGPGGVPQGGWTVIGFQTDNPGAWIMHCHIIWHADGGMALQYIEQPSAIDAAGYYGSTSFQNECAAYQAYEAAGGEGKLSYESGLKRDLLNKPKFEGMGAFGKRHSHHHRH